MCLRQVGAPEQIKEEVIRLRTLPGMWRTNFFVSDEEVARWCAKGELFLSSTEGSFLLLHNRETFCHAFFCTVELSDAEKALAAMTQKTKLPISMDILGKDDGLRTMVSQAGFRRVMTLKRMTRPNEDMQAGDLPIGDAEYAKSEEMPVLMEQLQLYFDPLTKQLPDEEELWRMIQKREVLVQRMSGNEVVGFLVFEPQGAVRLLRYILVKEEWRGKSLGVTLLNTFLGIRHGVRKHQLWVEKENFPAIRMYEEGGFQFDGLHDDIFIFPKSKQ